MIRNLVEKDHLRSYINRTMLMITRILKSQNSTSLILIVFLQVISFFSMVSVMFLTDPLIPSQANYIFKIFAIVNLCSIFGFDEQIILIILLVISTITLILIFINFMKQPSTQAVKALGYIVRLYQILTIPLVTYSLNNITSCIQQVNTFGTLLLKIILFAFTVLVMIFITLFTYFQIRPMRYNNLLWNYDNYQNFYRHIFNISRAVVLFYDKFSVVFVSVSLVIQVMITKMPYGYLIKKINVFNQCTNYFVIVVHITLLLSLTLKNGQLCFVFLCTGCLICLIYSVLDFWFLSEQEQQLPTCTFQNAAGLYSFYIHNKTKSKVTRDDTIKLGSHCLVCSEQNCIFLELPPANTNKIQSLFLQTKITQFLKQFRYSTPQSQLMYQIWKIQLNKTISLSHSMRKFSLIHKFVVQYALGPQNLQLNSESNNQSTNMGLSNDSFTFKWKFYKQISLALNQFQKLGQVMIKTLPQLNQVINVAIGIHYQTQALHKLFQQMVKMKQVNYICVELYLKFVQCFLDQKRISTQILDRLKKIKMLTDFQSIQQNPLPTFLVQLYTKNIQKVNAQALKFLRCQRYEIKDKKFDSIIAPQYNLKQLEALQQQNSKQEFLPVFFKFKNLNNYNMMCRNIKIKSLQINNKSYFQVTAHKRNFNTSIIQILVDSQENIVASTGQNFILSFRQGKEERTIQNLFKQYIKPILKQVSLSKISHIEFGKSCLINGLLAQKFCPYPQMRIFSINLIRKMNPRNTKRMTNLRLSRLYNKNPQFGFYYHQDSSQKLILQGIQTRQLSLLQFIQNPTDYNKFKQKLNTIGTQSKIRGLDNYAEGIKVYRLYNNDLYNIDLQDKQRYQEQFDGLKITSVSPLPKIQINQSYILVSLLVIALIIIGGTLFLQIQTSNSLDYILDQQISLLKILQFNLNFNRIISTLRDVLNGLFSLLRIKYTPLILNSYNDIQKMDESQFFSSNKYQAHFNNNQHYLGTLQQLTQVCLTHIYQFTQTRNKTMIPSIQKFAIKQIGRLIISEVGSKRQNLYNIYILIGKYSLISLITISVLCAIYLILYLLLSHKYKKNMSSFLQPLLITSDNEVRRILQECEKFKNAITSLYKNYQVQLQTLGTRKQPNKQRIRPKRINFGLYSIITQLIFGSLFIGALVMLTYIHYSKSSNETAAISKQFQQGYAAMTSYIDLSWISNQINYTNFVNQTQLTDLQSKLSLLENNKNDLGFSEQLSNDIFSLFFNQSCTYLVDKQIIASSWCNNSMIGFGTPDPFRINLDLYFRKAQYNLVANITQAFACTGIYSEPFKAIFKYLSGKIQQQIISQLTATQKTLMTFSMVTTAMSFCLILIVVGAYAYYKRKMKAINYGLVALSDKYQNNYYPKQGSMAEEQQKNKVPATSFEESDFPIFGNESKDMIRQN